MVFAMSADNMNAGLPCIFRSYQGVSNQMPDCALWEVLSATMAHPEMFKPVDIGPEHLRQSFIDGGLGCSNPTAHVMKEVKAILPGRYVSTVICIGAGHPDTIRLQAGPSLAGRIPANVLNLTRRIALDAERVAEDMETRFQSVPGTYFRLSVDQGMQAVKLSEWEKLSQVMGDTRAYMRGARVSARLDEAVAAIRDRKAGIEADRIGTEFLGHSRFLELTRSFIADGRIQPAIANQGTGYKACPAPTAVFTGREDTIDKITACIAKGDAQRCVFVLYGLGGSGKTQLALKTVQQTRHMWTDVVFVDATSHETATTTLAGFAKEKGVGESHESTLKWLGSQNARWLMIIDNADDSTLR